VFRINHYQLRKPGKNQNMTDDPHRKNLWIPVGASAVGSAILAFALYNLDAFEFIHDVSRGHEAFELDEIFLALVLASLITSFTWAIAVWQQLRRTERAYLKLSKAYERISRSSSEAPFPSADRA
tara:strand:- start:237 stop:611 length:375 start_codon:yes stop_codon:yes gene_type:complete